MNLGSQRLLVAGVTVLVFGAGYGARIWTERHQPLLQAPPELGREFVAAETERPSESREIRDRESLVKDIQRWNEDIIAYQARLTEIDQEFDLAFAALLTPEQRARFEEQQQRWGDNGLRNSRRFQGGLTAEDIAQLQRIPLMGAINRISTNATVDRLVRFYQLDEAQTTAVHDLALARRVEFLDLIDTTPPPSIRLSELAPLIDQLSQGMESGEATAPAPTAQ